MTKILKCKDCGNSPKSRRLEALTIAIARADLLSIKDQLADDICWRQIGRKPVVGVDAVCTAAKRYGPATTLKIDHVVSYGSAGAVDGLASYGTKQRAFCMMAEFSKLRGSKVKSVTVYSIRIP
jgi:hypothetical protein